MGFCSTFDSLRLWALSGIAVLILAICIDFLDTYTIFFSATFFSVCTFFLSSIISLFLPLTSCFKSSTYFLSRSLSVYLLSNSIYMRLILFSKHSFAWLNSFYDDSTFSSAWETLSLECESCSVKWSSFSFKSWISISFIYTRCWRCFASYFDSLNDSFSSSTYFSDAFLIIMSAVSSTAKTYDWGDYSSIQELSLIELYVLLFPMWFSWFEPKAKNFILLVKIWI